MKLGDIDDIYMNSYDKLKQVQEQETKLMDYIVQDDDTLFGLELKFRIGYDWMHCQIKQNTANQ